MSCYGLLYVIMMKWCRVISGDVMSCPLMSWSVPSGSVMSCLLCADLLCHVTWSYIRLCLVLPCYVTTWCHEIWHQIPVMMMTQQPVKHLDMNACVIHRWSFYFSKQTFLLFNFLFFSEDIVILLFGCCHGDPHGLFLDSTLNPSRSGLDHLCDDASAPCWT